MNSVNEPGMSRPPAISFSTLRLGRRYHIHDVDAFIASIESQLAKAIVDQQQVSAIDQLRNVQFTSPAPLRRGYDGYEVDTFLAVLADELHRRSYTLDAAPERPQLLPASSSLLEVS